MPHRVSAEQSLSKPPQTARSGCAWTRTTSASSHWLTPSRKACSLAFERQEAPSAIVQADYWSAARDGAGSSTEAVPDRRGLTGSARLFHDITRLDQFAFDTDRRKLQLTQTLPLARLDPLTSSGSGRPAC